MVKNNDITPAYNTLDDLPEDVLQELEADAAYINLAATLSYEMIRQAGVRLEMAKARIHAAAKGQADKFFMAWCERNFEESYSTLEKWRNVAKRLPPLSPEIAQRISKAALGKLAEKKVNPLGLQAALDFAQGGGTIDPARALIYAKAPDYIREAYVAEVLPEQVAHDVTKALISRSTPEPVQRYCIKHQVVHPDAVKYVADAYHRWERTRHTTRPSQTWQDLKAEDDGVLNGIGWSVHISKAEPKHLDRHRADRQSMYIEENGGAWDWIPANCRVIEQEGVIHIIIPTEHKHAMRQYIGGILMTKIRVPRKENP